MKCILTVGKRDIRGDKVVNSSPQDDELALRNLRIASLNRFQTTLFVGFFVLLRRTDQRYNIQTPGFKT